MSTGEHEPRIARQHRRRRAGRRGRSAQAQARPRGPDHRRRPVQEAPQGRDRPRRDRAAVRGVARRRCSKEAAVPGFRPGPRPAAARREAVPQAGRRAGQVDPADGLPRAARRGLQAQPDHPARARRRGDRAARRRADDGSRWTSRSGPTSRCRPTRRLTVKRPVKTITDADVEAQLKRVPRAVRPDRAQARRRRRDRRLRHGRPACSTATARRSTRPRRSSSGSSPSCGSRTARCPSVGEALVGRQAGRDAARPRPRSARPRPTPTSAARRSA